MFNEFGGPPVDNIAGLQCLDKGVVINTVESAWAPPVDDIAGLQFLDRHWSSALLDGTGGNL